MFNLIVIPSLLLILKLSSFESKRYHCNMDFKEEIKILLVKEKLSITKLAVLLTKKTGKNVSQQSISNKLSRDSLRASDLAQICECLGYSIKFEKKL